jgi:hypothetical protein
VADRFTAKKFQWLEQITFDKHSEGRGDAVRVGFAISTHINRKTGEAWPGLDHLAGVLGTNEKTVRRGIEWIEKHGHLTTKRGGNGGKTALLGECSSPEAKNKLGCQALFGCWRQGGHMGNCVRYRTKEVILMNQLKPCKGFASSDLITGK